MQRHQARLLKQSRFRFRLSPNRNNRCKTRRSHRRNPTPRIHLPAQARRAGGVEEVAAAPSLHWKTVTCTRRQAIEPTPDGNGTLGRHRLTVRYSDRRSPETALFTQSAITPTETLSILPSDFHAYGQAMTEARNSALESGVRRDAAARSASTESQSTVGCVRYGRSDADDGTARHVERAQLERMPAITTITPRARRIDESLRLDVTTVKPVAGSTAPEMTLVFAMKHARQERQTSTPQWLDSRLTRCS